MSDLFIDYPKTALEAKAQGLKLYFTGNPCPRGHLAPRRIPSRMCVVCNNKKRNEQTVRKRELAKLGLYVPDPTKKVASKYEQRGQSLLDWFLV